MSPAVLLGRGTSMDTAQSSLVIIPHKVSPAIFPDVVELECEVMLPLAAGSGELFEAMRLVLL